MSEIQIDVDAILNKTPEIGIEDYEKSIEAFLKLCDEHGELFMLKNKQYGNAIVTTGVLGASVELIGAVARLRELVLKDPKHGASNIKLLVDVYADIHNYANIALMMLLDNNFDGR